MQCLPYAKETGGNNHEYQDRLLEIVLFNLIGPALGLLRDREEARMEEKYKAISGMAAAVAPEMNAPLFAAPGTAQLLQDDFGP